jgi:hypothetical protein
MILKIMEVDGGDGTLYEEVTVFVYGNRIVNFYNSVRYFTKTKAMLVGKDPVYDKYIEKLIYY